MATKPDDIDLGSVDLISDLQSGGVPAAMTPEKVVPAPEDTGSIRDSLTAAFKKDGAPSDQAGATSAKAPEKPGEPARDDQGRFVPKPGDPPLDPAAAALAAAPAAPAAAPPALLAVPQGMSYEQMQKFTALPVEMQQFVARTLEDVNTRAARYGEYDQLEQGVFGPRREQMRIAGVSPVQFTEHLFSLSDFANRDPSAFVTWFADQHGLDLAEVSDGQQAPDPVIRSLQQQIEGLQTHISTFTTQHQQQALEQNTREVYDFDQEKDAQGNLVRPYFGQFMMNGEIQPYVSVVKQQNPQWSNRQVLEEAYNRACWSNPTVREQLTAAKAASEEAARLAAAREHAGRSREASASVHGAPRTPQARSETAPGDRSIREELQASFAAQRGDV
jgi:hypothetical protein